MMSHPVKKNKRIPDRIKEVNGMEKDRVQALLVRRMQDYIKAHLNEEELSVSGIAAALGYSERHCKRLFTRLTGKPIAEYIRLLRLTDAADKLRTSSENVLNIALSHQFQSHEGFTRAFRSAFGIAPYRYRTKKPPVPLFIAYPADHQYLIRNEEFSMTDNEKSTPVCTATIVSRDKRTLVFLPSKSAEDYMSFCEEMGCEWEGLLNSFEGKLDTAAIVSLPKSLVPKGYGSTAAAIELPAAYKGEIPQGYYTAALPAGNLLYFQSEPYENEEEFCTAIERAYRAYEGYDPKRFGYTYDFENAPSFNFGAQMETGARLAFPVRKI